MVEPEADMLSIASCKALSFASLSVFSCSINFCKLASAFSLAEDSAGIKFVFISLIAVALVVIFVELDEILDDRSLSVISRVCASAWTAANNSVSFLVALSISAVRFVVISNSAFFARVISA